MWTLPSLPTLSAIAVIVASSGASQMVIETGETPNVLRDRVTSPGGTTLAGLAVLHERGFHDAVSAAVVAAAKRSRELGQSSG